MIRRCSHSDTGFVAPQIVTVSRRLSQMMVLVAAGFLVTNCSGGSGGGNDGSGGGGGNLGGSDAANFACDGACSGQNLSTGEVSLILSNSVLGANTLGLSATIAVTDRVGNVLAVYRMPGAPLTTTIQGNIGAQGGLEGLTVDSGLAAISKAGTGAYLSSQGNAFSTRTASQIVQENFNPGERNQPGGPLFGVQFSQLPCGDVTTRNPEFAGGLRSGGKPTVGGLVGPRFLPLGLSADPGGIPLYKNGDLVGGLGIEFDGAYTFDRNIRDTDNALEERVALYGSRGFEAPSERTAANMIVGGKSLRYVDISYDDLDPTIAVVPELVASGFLSISEFTDGRIREGAVFGTPASGVANTTRAGLPAMTLVDAAGGERFPLRNGTVLPGGAELKADEVDALLDSALLTAFRARAAIRRPLDSAARVSIWVVDTAGIPLGFTRSQDAPVFGIDVSLQKARSAAFMSSADAAAQLAAAGFGSYVAAAQQFIGGDALTGRFAITERAIGNLARPFYVDGINGNRNGPLSLPFPGTDTAASTWSPFNTGLQLDLAVGNLARALGLSPSSSFPSSCADSAVFGRRLANGLQIFPGAVPLYRNGTLVGAIGISGDGIDQDDLTAFFGASASGLSAVGRGAVGDPALGFNAPIAQRIDVAEFNGLLADGTRLRYVNCPEGPFRGENDQNVCDTL